MFSCRHRLHDYYRFNLSTFVNEGAIETEDIRAETTGELTVWDAFKIGVKGANSMLLGSGIDIMLEAFDKVSANFIKRCLNQKYSCKICFCSWQVCQMFAYRRAPNTVPL
jgi:hypothetical protein